MFSYENVNIYGIGFTNFEFSSDEIEKLELEDTNNINILVMHGTLNGGSKKYFDISSKCLEKFDYVALGHIHEKKVDDSNIIYPGSLTSIGFDEEGEHGIVIGNIEKDNISYEFKNMEYKHFKVLEINISDLKSPEEILNKLDLGEDIYKIVLTGERNVEIEKIKDIIEAEGKNVCVIKDQTYIAYDLEKIAKAKTLKGFFAREMLDELNNHPENKDEILKAIEITFKVL